MLWSISSFFSLSKKLNLVQIKLGKLSSLANMMFSNVLTFVHSIGVYLIVHLCFH